MFWLWLIVAILLIAVGSYALGRNDFDGDVVGIFWIIFIASLSWPAVLLAAMIVGPFYGFYWLGNRKREKLMEKESTTNK